MKKIFAMAFIALTALSACTGNDDDSNTSGTTLVRTMTEDAGTANEEVSTFTYDGTKLKRVSYDSASYEKFTYTGDLLTMMEYYEDGELVQKLVLAYNAQGQLTSATNYDMDSDDPEFSSIYKTAYVYNADGTISTTTYSDEAGTDIDSTGTLTFVNGNLTVASDTYATSTYTFDTKNSPYKNIKGYAAIVLAVGEGGINNMLSIHDNTDDSPTTYTYTYNEDGFPLTQTEVYNNETSLTKYTY